MKKTLLLFFAFLSMVSKADDIVKVDGIYFDIYNGEAYVTNLISGYSKNSYSGSIVIPETIEYEGQTIPVTAIGAETFQDCTGLISIKLPQNLKTIGERAFQRCSSLEEIEIPANVNTINSLAFDGCGGLCRIVVDNENAVYDSRDNCNAIINKRNSSLILGCKNTRIPDGVQSIAGYAFRNNTGLTSIDIPGSVVAIGESAFEGCSNFTEVGLNEGLKTIGYRAFANCTSIKAIVIPASVRNIQKWTGGYSSPILFSKGNSAFEGCTGLESIKVSSGNSVYDSRNNCNGIIESETNTLLVGCKTTVIPESVSELFIGAFQYCSTLESLHIPSSIINLRDAYFLGCTGLKSITVDNNNPYYDSRNDCNAIINKVTNTLEYGCINTVIPNSVETIGNYAFFHYDKWLPLTSIVIPSNVTGINRGAFSSCRIENVIAKNAKTSMGSGSFSNQSYQHAMVYIPQGTWSEAVFDGGWYLFNNIREIAMESNILSSSMAYTLMDTKTCEYAVVGNSADDVEMERAFYSIDEKNPNTSWQIVKRKGENYLYNIGVRKYASLDTNGEFSLSTEPIAIQIDNSENGLKLGNCENHSWGFVLNKNVQAETNLTAIGVVSEDVSNSRYYSINGQKFVSPVKGINIIRDDNGYTRKIIKR